jgi:hypothetical protein
MIFVDGVEAVPVFTDAAQDVDGVFVDDGLETVGGAWQRRHRRPHVLVRIVAKRRVQGTTSSRRRRRFWTPTKLGRDEGIEQVGRKYESCLRIMVILKMIIIMNNNE